MLRNTIPLVSTTVRMLSIKVCSDSSGPRGWGAKATSGMGWMEAAAAAAHAAGTPSIRRESTAARVRCRSRSEAAKVAAGELFDGLVLLVLTPETHDLHFIGPIGLFGDWCCLGDDDEDAARGVPVAVAEVGAVDWVPDDAGDGVVDGADDSNREQFA